MQQSVRFQITMELIEPEAPRSTCHHGYASRFVWLTDPSKKFPSVLPSTALDATVFGPKPPSVLLCVAIFPAARLVSIVVIAVESLQLALADPPPETVT